MKNRKKNILIKIKTLKMKSNIIMKIMKKKKIKKKKMKKKEEERRKEVKRIKRIKEMKKELKKCLIIRMLIQKKYSQNNMFNK